jgi:flagellar biosynthetic protein FliO
LLYSGARTAHRMTHSLCSFLALGTPATRPDAGGPDMTQYVLVCFVLLGLICGAAFLFRRFIASSVRTRASKRSLQVVDLLPLGGKQRLCVVRCYDRTFALGLGDKEVALIAELDAVTAPAQKPATSFAALLRREQRSEPAQPPVDLPPTVTAAPRAKRSLFTAGSLFG